MKLIAVTLFFTLFELKVMAENHTGYGSTVRPSAQTTAGSFLKTAGACDPVRPGSISAPPTIPTPSPAPNPPPAPITPPPAQAETEKSPAPKEKPQPREEKTDPGTQNEPERRPSPSLDAQSADIFRARCLTCHNGNGRGEVRFNANGVPINVNEVVGVLRRNGGPLEMRNAIARIPDAERATLQAWAQSHRS